jgi:ornithine decarboxylase
MKHYRSAAALVRETNPMVPVIGMRPRAAARAARWLLANFPGDVAYAYKANDNPLILGALYGAGVRHFDVASLPEVEEAFTMPGVHLHFMNPIKPRHSIRLGYSAYGVRSFSLDSQDELDKIFFETNHARDLLLFVRMAVPNNDSAIPLDRKFGIDPQGAIRLLKKTRKVAQKVGISFHVGSQMLQPLNYTRAIAKAADVAKAAGVELDYLDVGGGLPARHPGSEPPHLSHYISEIKSAVHQFGFERSRLLSEPGRALVAEAESVVVRVIGRRGANLHISDGTYGCFFEGAKIYGGLSYPTRLIRNGEFRTGEIKPFVLWGPSCDSIDHMPGPFYLPEDVREGDFIEVGQLGAYGRVSRSNFNGFGAYEQVILDDEPMCSMYEVREERHETHEKQTQPQQVQA